MDLRLFLKKDFFLFHLIIRYEDYHGDNSIKNV